MEVQEPKFPSIFEQKPNSSLFGYPFFTGTQAFPTRGAQNCPFGMLVSLKGKSFGHQTLQKFYEIAQKSRQCGFISVVDTPYRWNEAAISKESTESHKSIIALSQEVWRRINNVAVGYPDAFVRHIVWDDLVRQTPKYFFEEFMQAYGCGGELHRYLKQVTSVVFQQRKGTVDLNLACHFLLEELPTLCWMYYAMEPQFVDVYPAPPLLFFRKLEDGYFSQELPEISKIATSGRCLLQLNLYEDMNTRI